MGEGGCTDFPKWQDNRLRSQLESAAPPAPAQPCGEAPWPLLAAPFVPLEAGESSPHVCMLVTGHSGHAGGLELAGGMEQGLDR